ncbi:hypothetical protein R5R35_010797 [Gryllus longicercus]|uniref:Uncharacterized protein n=2 Tax=Gryllus longicercus TaxID=2509291 RepID=A0AAN9Z3W9_9ORTH
MKRRVLSMDLPTTTDNVLVERNREPLGISLINPYAVGKRDHSDIVALAEEISKADTFVQATTCSKLQIIAEQMRFLQQQALQVLSEAKESFELNHAACNFKKIPGHTYHLYKRESGQTYFSMLSPQDWAQQGGPPHKYIGAYHLKEDLTWITEEKLQQSSFNFSDIAKMGLLPTGNIRQQQIEAITEKMDC